MGLKLPSIDNVVKATIWAIVIFATLLLVINFNALSTGKGDILKQIPEDFFTKSMGYIIFGLAVWLGWKLSTGFVGETFNRRSLITLAIVGVLLGGLYFYVLQPYVATGHLPFLDLDLSASVIRHSPPMQALVGP